MRVIRIGMGAPFHPLTKEQRIALMYASVVEYGEDDMVDTTAPFHPNCRCTTPEQTEEERVRRARNVTPVQRRLPAP